MKSPCSLKQSLLRPVNFFCQQRARLACGRMGVICLKEPESHCATSSTVSHLQCRREGAAEDIYAQHMAAPTQQGAALEPKVPQSREAQTAWADGAGHKRSEGPAQPSQTHRTHSPQLAPSPLVLCCWHLWPSLDCSRISALSCLGCSLAEACPKGAWV